MSHHDRHGKARKNERKYAHVVELVVTPDDGLDVSLSRRIVEFHKSRRLRRSSSSLVASFAKWVARISRKQHRSCRRGDLPCLSIMRGLDGGARSAELFLAFSSPPAPPVQPSRATAAPSPDICVSTPE
jgi:hypothetical protein